MNTDYGFFNLFFAPEAVRKAINKPLPAEPDSKGELPEIDYSLLRVDWLLGGSPVRRKKKGASLVAAGSVVANAKNEIKTGISKSACR
jgi:hypothetical protein